MTALRFLRNWFPAFVWLLIILGASTDLMSSQRTSRIIRPILLWFNPEISPQTIRKVQFVVRKGGHLAGYAILAMLLWRGLQGSRNPQDRSWKWRIACGAFAISIACAAMDEFHQSFVISRDGSIRDVILDATGALLGLCLIWAWMRWRQRQQERGGESISEGGLGQPTASESG